MKRYPLVSLLTPTCNRHPFISQYLRNLRRQDYPGRMEILIADDGDEPVGDLVSADPRVRYLRLSGRRPLGEKRNLLASAARGEVLVHMDDDDYYPPERVTHAVSRLEASDRLIAGSSQMYIYDTVADEVTVSGPFGENHGTAATLAYRREYFAVHRFDDRACAQEEPTFTENFTAPMVQLDPRSTILVIRHQANTWDKRRTTARPSDLKLKDFVRDMEDRRFYRHRLARVLAAGTSASAG